MKANLVYFTVGGHPDYINLLQFCLETLHENCDMTNTFIMVMCDEKYLPYVNKLKETNQIDDIMVTADNNNHIETSMKKVRIFEYSRIWEFEKVLFLDCDIIILKDIIANLMSNIEDEEKLYVFTESTIHTLPFHSFLDYTDEQLQFFKDNNIRPFNCGQFAFRVTEPIYHLFSKVCDLVNERTTNYFYEQSHMNYVFNLANATISLLNNYFELANIFNSSKSNQNVIHFAYGNVPFTFKLEKMKLAYKNRTNLNMNDYYLKPKQTSVNKLVNKFGLHRFF